MNSSRDAEAFDADVIAAFGRHLLVRDASGRELRARPSGRRMSIVCGDRVRCEPDRKHDELLIVEVLPRRTLLARANLRGESEPVVANITQGEPPPPPTRATSRAWRTRRMPRVSAGVQNAWPHRPCP